MLRYFAVENFKAFSGKAEFEMFATREQVHRERVYRDRRERTLPVTAIFGSNASGKSALVQALSVLQESVVAETLPSRLLVPYRGNSADTPLTFTLEFSLLSQGKREIYSYELSILHGIVVHETLTYVRPTVQTIIFSRDKDRLSHIDHDLLIEYVGPQDLQSLSGEMSLILFRGFLRNNATFLGSLARSFGPPRVIRDVYQWFTSVLTVIPADAHYLALPVLFTEESQMRDKIVDAMRFADISIDDVHLEVVAVDQVQMPRDEREEFEDTLRRDNHESALVSTERGEHYIVSVDHETGRVTYKTLVTTHRSSDGETYTLRWAEESDGTRHFLNLLPVIYVLCDRDMDQVVVIDELDRSLHPMLSRAFVEQYLLHVDTDVPSRHQLIFTTHETIFLDDDLLRRDEKWFIGSTDGSPDLFRLSDFPSDIARKGSPLRTLYLEGRLGGVPTIGSRMVGA